MQQKRAASQTGVARFFAVGPAGTSCRPTVAVPLVEAGRWARDGLSRTSLGRSAARDTLHPGLRAH